MIIAQYYQFVRLGFEGYKHIMTSLMSITKRLQDSILEKGTLFLLISNKYRARKAGAFCSVSLDDGLCARPVQLMSHMPNRACANSASILSLAIYTLMLELLC